MMSSIEHHVRIRDLVNPLTLFSDQHLKVCECWQWTCILM
jgi:hypothetical protein